MNKNCRVSVQLSRRHYDYVKAIAERTGSSISSVIRWLIIKDMHEKQNQ